MTIDHRDHTMYVPAWQGLTFRSFIAHPERHVAPFPFLAPHRTAFHTARSAIFHLFNKLVASGRTKVLAPDHHMGNELRAIGAAGAQVELYPIGRDGQPDLDEISRRCSRGTDVLLTMLEWANHTRSHSWLFISPNRMKNRWLHRFKFQLLPRIHEHPLLRVIRSAGRHIGLNLHD